ncbi:type I site-specific restriction-modificationsystem, S subunit [Vibrio vulnificus]|uniref:restriction endonuclease subunit S n=1 Tax=Vibrio TaxID=662 RepID=UPI0005EE3EB4|nr:MULTISPECIES: restriction endonuclease subunit S [Vibrio]KJR23108.1 hypothetical protein UF06_18740 [Vibrio sp. S234-5]MBE4605692.1 hypothetical protein [Vibrio navarrensis]OQK62544.1 type I site-specific restriction-modificationsystem, S subunit [Vibrio vulnificus]OQK64774.1 type I site-specific restriction-modificationsystem, S subunit [Vibrio vulnificus]
MTGRYKQYSNYISSGTDWIGEVPNHWEVKRLKYIFDIKKRIAGRLGFDVLSITQKGIIVKDIESGDGQLSMDYSKYQLVFEGDFAMNHMDLLTGYVDISRFDGVTSPDYRVFTLKSSKRFNARYYLYLLQMCYKQKIFFPLGQGSAHLGRWRLPTEAFNEVVYPYPSCSEQQKIANFLDHETAKIDTLIAKQEKLIELLKEKRQAVISHAVTKGLNPDAPMKDSGVEWLGEVPEHWTVGRYKFCTNRIIVGIAEAATHAYADSGVPLIRSTNIKENSELSGEYLFLKEEFAVSNSSKYLFKNDVVTVRTGYPGVSAVVPKHLDRCHCFTNLVATPNKSNQPYFLASYLNSHIGKAYFELQGWGSAQQNISVPILQNTPIASPPLSEQVEICLYINKQRVHFKRLISNAERSIDLMKERKTALISAAVTGKIDVRHFVAEQGQPQGVQG